MNNFYSSLNKVSTHCMYITWQFSWRIWRRCLKYARFWPLRALPLGPHGGHTNYLNNFESPTPKDDSCHVWLKSNHAFSRRRWKSVKSLWTTDDGQKQTAIAHLRFQEEDENVKSLWTTDDGQKQTAIAHLEPLAQVSLKRLRFRKGVWQLWS